jgi:hypothetical protein
MHQALQGATFHVEHIVPRSRGGDSSLGNLALACPGCNLRKSDRVEFTDPRTHQMSRLFHPRQDEWTEHFRWEIYRLEPLTAVARATIAALDLNRPRLLQIRQAEKVFGLFPPPGE